MAEKTKVSELSVPKEASDFEQDLGPQPWEEHRDQYDQR